MDAQLFTQVLTQSRDPPERLAELSRSCRIGATTAMVIALVPFFLLGASFLCVVAEATRPVMLWMLEENHPVEFLTFVFLLIGNLAALRLACTLRSGGESPLVYGFYAIFSLGLFVLAMEEVAWGQRLLGFETPAWLLSINRQGEMTFHNIGVMQGRTEWMRLAFAIGGIADVLVSRWPRLAKISAPVVLLPWFLLITVHAAVDAYNDFVPIQGFFDFAMQRTSEVVELLIAAAALLYVGLNWRRFRFGTRPRNGTRDAP